MISRPPDGGATNLHLLRPPQRLQGLQERGQRLFQLALAAKQAVICASVSAAVLLASTLATALTCSGSAPGQTCAVAAAVTDFGAKSAPSACCTCGGSSCFDSGF
jgi:hypothetical protein